MNLRKSEIKQRIKILEKRIAEFDSFVFPPEGRRITHHDIEFEIMLINLGRKLELEGILYNENIPGL